MKQHPSVARTCAAVVTAAALTLGAGSLLAPAEAGPAAKKPMKGRVTGTVPMTCNVFGTDFDYDAKIKLTGTRAKKSDKKLKLKATFSDMPGVAPVPIDNDVQTKLKLKAGPTAGTLKGKGHVTADASAPVPVPPVKGAIKNKKNSLPVTVVSLSFYIPDYDMTMACAPTESGALGTLKVK